MTPLAVLLQLSDSALPTGGFSHSFGLEQYLARGQVHDRVTYEQWLQAYIANQLTCTDALLMRLSYEGVDEADLADRAAAAALPAQVRAADVAMAKRLRAIGEDALAVPATDVEHAHPALEFARIARHVGVGMDEAILGHLTAAVGSLTQNAVRAIPIGQTDGQRAIAAAHAWVHGAVETVHGLDPDALGAVAPGLEIAQMQHERLRARMFMS